MAARSTALLFVAVAAALGTAHGASYTVGAPAGSWDLRTNYTAWASTITFRARDQLVFKYSRALHNVLEVSKADYDSCSSSNPINAVQTGDDTITLPAGGVTRYFICGVPGHCDDGMKLAVRVEAAAGPNASAPSSPSTPFAMPPRRAEGPASGGRPSAASPPSSSDASSAASVVSLAGLGLAALIAFF
ncbi:hypothetical protein PR202_ga30772 [Eleusine coracana subsp. coracana]|uniref:Phytocyanin domain-containing protein n=1 Tax=Eleusine coracana subsp. coracana TaxID=191504 RepID=A0AAV5DRE9_ELECO|nr:hypothetical protein QOZ80_8AG0616690 [Eleusine coracana subsp. coracana]GJN12490.1 hypothetical protein PR202_ga30772 [Eleusine coracana subsp. coracana]